MIIAQSKSEQCITANGILVSATTLGSEKVIHPGIYDNK